MINLLYAVRMVLHLLPLNSSNSSCVRLMCTKGNRRRSKNKMKEFLDQLFKKKNQLDSTVKPFFTLSTLNKFAQNCKPSFKIIWFPSCILSEV